MTLIELLVVIVILMMVTAIAIPVLAPNVEQKRIREAARLVSQFVEGARTRAQAQGRPVGVQFERLISNPNASMALSYVEVPPLYSGESIGSGCKVYKNQTSGQYEANFDPAGSGDFTTSLIHVGDLVKINYQGHLYRIVSPQVSANDTTVSASTVTIQPVDGSARLPWATIDPSDSTAMAALTTFPYQIVRRPTRTSAVPIQLTEGAVVDLSVSGIGTDFFGFGSSVTDPVILMFSPGGSISDVYLNGVSVGSTSQPVSFMIGRSDGVAQHNVISPNNSENVSFDNTRTIWNLRDLNNLWVSVGGQTGMVSTSENARITDSKANYPIDLLNPSPDFPVNVAIGNSRGIAQSFQSMGGR